MFKLTPIAAALAAAVTKADDQAVPLNLGAQVRGLTEAAGAAADDVAALRAELVTAGVLPAPAPEAPEGDQSTQG